MPRVTITRPEWDRVFYRSPQVDGQVKLAHETEAEETAKVAAVLADLAAHGFLASTEYSPAAFQRFRARVHENFFVIWTAINPPMERLLYALSAILQPRDVLGLGIFTGNPLIWSLGPALDGTYSATRLAGVEIDPNYGRLCQDNMDQVRGAVPVTIHAADGFDVLEEYGAGEIDLLYLDANGFDPDSGREGTKRVNYSLLKKAYPKLRPGAHVFCHNAYQPSFRAEAAAYLDFTADARYFRQTATIGVDEMGLEVSVKV